MKQLKLLACALALTSLALFTGCGGGDDNNGGNPAPVTGTNAPAALSTGSTITATGDDATTTTVEIPSDGRYHAVFADGTIEDGSTQYTASGDNATLVLVPDNGSANTTFNMAFNSDQKSGTYTSEVGSGTFSIAGGTPATP